ncbi:hypothetical protein HIM_04374 [Hirsutella minnesotensis 3608]|uniref:Transcription factor TFIIIC triple barrel domain-containing protein n=1 Tax=Hirsutella minnesotensis 3608 TaxID=1043627 RepID=A0A0F8A1K7_9HYPO|nr:hypothetical protein HIM_04374 [Hirsutella minnesotensis 3608]
MSSFAASGGLGADEPGTVGVDEVLRQVLQDDQEEWEYEYSTTETETYYLTLELSYPEFKDRATRAPHHSRGGYYKNWTDQSAAYSRASAGKPKDGIDGMQSDEDGDGDLGGDGPEDDEDENDGPDENYDADGTPLDPMLQAASKGAGTGDRTSAKGKAAASGKPPGNDNEDDPKMLEDIQILELHSEHPVISYRGRIFEGEWAEVIGTEAILARHDKGAPLPALRNLADDIDVLAASSSRIMTKEKVAKRKDAGVDALAAIKEEWNIRIPVGKDKQGERAQQVGFLENLIALKKRRGDTDNVTVYAMDGAGKDWDDRHGPDYRPRVRRKPTTGDGEGDGAGAGGQGKRGGRRRRRPVGPGGKYVLAAGQEVRPELSTPTPSRWDDLSRPGNAQEGAPGGQDGGGEIAGAGLAEDMPMSGCE